MRPIAKALTLAACVFGVALSAATPSVGAKELKFSHFAGPQHVMQEKVFQPWAEEVKKRSNGDLTVRIFPSMQLGGTPPGLIDQIRNGVADLGWSVAGYNATQFPRLMMLELPGLTESPMHLTKIAYELSDQLANDFEDVKPLAFWSNDSAVLITRTKPVRTLEDLKGLKIRTASAGQSELIKALGGVPVSMPVTQVYTSLERGVLDGTMIGASGVTEFRFDEVARHLTINAPLGRSPFYIAMNKRSYEALSPEHKKIVDETTGEQLSRKAGEAYEAVGKEAVEKLKASGRHEVIELSAAEQKRWLDAVAPLYQQWTKKAAAAGAKADAMLEQARAIKP